MIIIIFGLPGSGKSYFAKQLATEINAFYYNTDILRKELYENPVYEIDSKLSVYDFLLQKLEPCKTIVLDGTFFNSDVRKKFRDKIRELNESEFFIEIIAKETLIKERTSIVREDSDADYSVYMIIKNQFEPMEEPHLVLESTNSNIDEMIQKAVLYLNLER